MLRTELRVIKWACIKAYHKTLSFPDSLVVNTRWVYWIQLHQSLIALDLGKLVLYLCIISSQEWQQTAGITTWPISSLIKHDPVIKHQQSLIVVFQLEVAPKKAPEMSPLVPPPTSSLHAGKEKSNPPFNYFSLVEGIHFFHLVVLLKESY